MTDLYVCLHDFSFIPFFSFSKYWNNRLFQNWLLYWYITLLPFKCLHPVCGYDGQLMDWYFLVPNTNIYTAIQITNNIIHVRYVLLCIFLNVTDTHWWSVSYISPPKTNLYVIFIGRVHYMHYILAGGNFNLGGSKFK